MQNHIDRVLLGRGAISDRVRALGDELARDLTGELVKEGSPADATDRIVFVPVMTGALVFTADLIRHLPLPIAMRLVSVSSYPGAATQSKGATLKSYLSDDLAGRHVVIIDDILDTGETMRMLRGLVEDRRPASVRACVLLKKQLGKPAVAEAEHVGFEIPDEFVVGYGLDYDGHYRNLPDICVLKREAYEG